MRIAKAFIDENKVLIFQYEEIERGEARDIYYFLDEKCRRVQSASIPHNVIVINQYDDIKAN
jgi:hypothetical protein